MALTIGNTTTSSANTFSFTTSADAEILIVVMEIRTGVGAPSVSSVTFDGNAMTQAIGTKSGQNNSQIYYLVNPPQSTTANVVVTLSATPDGDEYWAMDLSGGVDTDDPIGTTFSSNGGNDTSRTITPVAGEGIIVSTIREANATNITGNSVTEVRSYVNVSGPWYAAGGYVAHTGSDTAVSYTITGGDGQAQQQIAEIKEASGGGAGGSFAGFMF